MPKQPIRMYHNPRCSKSREALTLLRERGLEPEVVHYLDTPPSPEELETLAKMLGVRPHALLRTKEEAYTTANLSEASNLPQIAQAIQVAPILLERPIVIVGDRAVIGRPPEKVLELL